MLPAFATVPRPRSWSTGYSSRMLLHRHGSSPSRGLELRCRLFLVPLVTLLLGCSARIHLRSLSPVLIGQTARLKRCGAQEYFASRGSRRSLSPASWERQSRHCMVLIADVVSNYKRRKIDATAAVADIKWFLEIESSTEGKSDSEERGRNLQELFNMHSSFRGHQSPQLNSQQPASTISPEVTVGEAVAHASGTL